MEEVLPYYKLGDYRSFLKSDYADLVIKTAELDHEPCLTLPDTLFSTKIRPR